MDSEDLRAALPRDKELALDIRAPGLREAKCNTVEQMQLVNTLCRYPMY